EEARKSKTSRGEPSVVKAAHDSPVTARPSPPAAAAPVKEAPDPGASKGRTAGRRGRLPSRRSPMAKRQVEIIFEGPPPVPTPVLPAEAVHRTGRAKKPRVSVLDVNKSFYRALESRDIGVIARIWANDGSVRCTQPNGVLLRGWEEVRRGFEQIFSSDRPHKIELTQVYAEESDSLAYVSLVERVAMPQASRPRREHSSTNVFRNEGGRWFMVNHHST
ncbi:nuclear transport factor 2 family protein, partial [Planctomycetota bacterium]